LSRIFFKPFQNPYLLKLGRTNLANDVSRKILLWLAAVIQNLDMLACDEMYENMTSITANFRYAQSDSVVARVIAGETLIVPVRGGVGDLASIYSLNELGSFIWRHLQPAKTWQELVSLVMDEYDVTAEVAQRDVGIFIGKIKDAGIIREMAA
jgi:coenzyme PQQ synthesis protein D (PqqD)